MRAVAVPQGLRNYVTDMPSDPFTCRGMAAVCIRDGNSVPP
jgi:hypothetical protein